MIQKVKEDFKNGIINKVIFIDEMSKKHQSLFEYVSLLQTVDISSIEIRDDGVLFTTKNDGIRFICKKTDQRELGGKSYIIADSIKKMNWKVAGETKVILGHNCMKATTQRMQESFRMSMDNGEAKREKVMDTLNIVAWFTNEIPGSFGPDMYQGQLPGTILEIDVNNGRTSYKAIEISPKVDVAKIKEPSKGKKATPEEFAKEREKLMQEMMQNNGGPGMRVNIRN